LTQALSTNTSTLQTHNAQDKSDRDNQRLLNTQNRSDNLQVVQLRSILSAVSNCNTVSTLAYQTSITG